MEQVPERKKPGRKLGTSDKPFRVEVRLSSKAKEQLDQAIEASKQAAPNGKPRTATSIIESGIERELTAIRKAVREKKRADEG